MGIHMSKRASSSNQNMSNLHFTADHLSSYKAACKMDVDMQSFDTTLQTQTTGVIHSLAEGVEVKSLSFESLKQTTECLLELNQEVVKVILDCKKDIWGNQELFELVEEFFENSLKTLDFCAALEKCLKRARDSHLLIKLALQHFEENPKNRERFLEELKNFKDSGDPFTEEFFQVFHSVYLRQVQMLEKLKLKKKKLDKKLKHIKSWRRLSRAIFAAAFAAVLICAVVAAAIAAPPVAAALAAATSIPVGSMGKWIDLLVRNYEKAVGGQKEAVNYMSVGTRVAIKDLENIRAVVERVAAEVEAVAKRVDFVIGESEGGGLEIAVGEIRRSLEVFVENVEELGVQADNCSRDIRMARTVILQRIIKHPQN